MPPHRESTKSTSSYTKRLAGLYIISPLESGEAALILKPLSVTLSNAVPEVATTGKQTDRASEVKHHSVCETVLGAISVS